MKETTGMDAMHYYAAHSWNLSHHLSTSQFTAGPHTKTLNTSRNDSTTMIQFPMQMNFNALAQLQWQRSQRKVLWVWMQPQNSMQMQNRTKKTYLLQKTLLKALKMSTTEMSDAKTPARAEKLWQRAIAPSAQKGHLSYAQPCCTKCQTSHKTHCRWHWGCQLRASQTGASRRQRRVSWWPDAWTGRPSQPTHLNWMQMLTGQPQWLVEPMRAPRWMQTSTRGPCWAENWQWRPVEPTRVTGSTNANRGSNKLVYKTKKTISVTKTHKKTYLAHMDCRSRGSGQYMRVVRQLTPGVMQMCWTQPLSMRVIQVSRKRPRTPKGGWHQEPHGYVKQAHGHAKRSDRCENT